MIVHTTVGWSDWLICNVPTCVYILDPHSLVFVGITMWAQRLDPFLLKMTEAFTSVSGVNVVQVVGRSVNPRM